MSAYRPIRDRLLDKVKIDIESGCWLFTASKDDSGYGKIAVGKNKYDRTHRVAWRLFKGEIPDGSCVLHRCDVRHCVNPEHLMLGTQNDNMQDMIGKGRKWSKITPEDAKRIMSDPRTLAEIALDYGISFQNVSLIKNGKRWKRIKGDNLGR